MNFAVWNTLHDGTIESITGSVPGDIVVRVGIPYLCAKLPTTADYVVVHLRGCRRFEYQPYDSDATTELPGIVAADVIVLSAEEIDGLVSICCAGAFLKLVYERADASLAEGPAVSQEELEAAADRYWTEWERNFGSTAT